ncbi:hypothetical protein [Salarchaeum japonicum]|uniref:hypothetical protein n=1 Tax=Salarchaeum japonicum TaxID=555573 RepID=UPI003C733756
MPHVAEARVVDFDADEAVDSLRTAVGDYLGAVAEYDRETPHLLYASDVVLELFDGIDSLEAFTADFHGHVAHDFYERELFRDFVPMSNDVNGFVTRMDNAVIVRYLVGDQGLFVSTEPTASIDAIFDVLDRTAGQD